MSDDVNTGRLDAPTRDPGSPPAEPGTTVDYAAVSNAQAAADRPAPEKPERLSDDDRARLDELRAMLPAPRRERTDEEERELRDLERKERDLDLARLEADEERLRDLKVAEAKGEITNSERGELAGLEKTIGVRRSAAARQDELARGNAS